MRPTDDSGPSVLDRGALEGGAVLVVDDDPAARAVVREILGGRCRVEEAGDGAEALEAIGSLEDLRLVVTDVKMPRLDGLAFVRRLRSDSRFATLPVIVQTADAGPRAVDAFRGLEVERVLSKEAFRTFLRTRLAAPPGR